LPETITTWAPVKLWETNAGEGVSSVIAYGGRVCGAGHRARKDTVYCRDVSAGNCLWSQSYDCQGDHTSDCTLPGPRPTPATDGRRPYVFSREGSLRCMDTTTGKVLWIKTPKELGANIGPYGIRNLPRLYGRLLVCDLNATCTALNKISGAEVWRSQGSGWNGAAPMAPSLLKIIAIANQKGGTATTTMVAYRRTIALKTGHLNGSVRQAVI